MSSRFLIFPGIVLVVLLGASFFIYYSAIKFWPVQNPHQRMVLLAAIISLSTSFLAISIVSHFWHNLAIKYFYIFSATWIGIGFHLFLASAAIWFIWMIIAAANLEIKVRTVSLIIYGLAVLYAIYGMYSSRNLQVTELRVRIKNLPPAWRGKTVMQISDIHLGNVYGPDFMDDLAQKINALKPELIFITGDLFDGMDGSLPTFVAPLNKLQAARGIYFITGNHETYLGVDKVFSLLRQTKITILQNDVVDIGGLQIIGLQYGFEHLADMEHIVRSHRNFVQGKPTILLYHIPRYMNQADRLGVNLQLAGHTHAGQMYPLNYITSRVFAGYDYGLFTHGDLSLYTTSGVGTWGPPVRTTKRPEIVKIHLE